MTTEEDVEPRDPLGLVMFAAWVNVQPVLLPPDMRYHTCTATQEAWDRVAMSVRAFMAAEAPQALHDMIRGATLTEATAALDLLASAYRKVEQSVESEGQKAAARLYAQAVASAADHVRATLPTASSGDGSTLETLLAEVEARGRRQGEAAAYERVEGVLSRRLEAFIRICGRMQDQGNDFSLSTARRFYRASKGSLKVVRDIPRDTSALETLLSERTAGLREALIALVSASLNDMTTQGLPLEWSAQSAIAQAFRSLGMDCDRLTPEARALLSGNWIDGFDGQMPDSNPPVAKLESRG